ncbi:VOC family protein [Actinokineospora enzanensis]|uniref:VOC family protein n=1 Tax=Actinokineospora enzanensis TaxID=155975 RepID=UPI000378A1F3|nr:VOC family protein [Actinokineospora enzanensis]
MNPPRALWLPFEVDDFAATRAFYVDGLGLSVVDQWVAGAERGVVLRAADAAYVELVSPGIRRSAPLAFELPDRASVDAVHARLVGVEVLRPPGVYPRGHYGFEVRDPAGTPVMLWHEHD